MSDHWPTVTLAEANDFMKTKTKKSAKRASGSLDPVVMQHRALLKEILKHQIANLGSKDHEFYSCYTYEHGEMPPWVAKAKALLHNEKVSDPRRA